eukprot:PhF_6_TR3684/c0_g1_i1/m.5236/K07359/CAMKK2; calcium/calmodulin-dependent protein kinase kinase 2
MGCGTMKAHKETTQPSVPSNQFVPLLPFSQPAENHFSNVNNNDGESTESSLLPNEDSSLSIEFDTAINVENVQSKSVHAGRVNRINAYQVADVLGFGVSARVDLASDTSGVFAIKTSDGGGASTHEANIMMRFRHPNLVPLRHVIQDKDTGEMHLVMEFMSRGVLGRTDLLTTQPAPIALDCIPRFRCQFLDIVHGLEYLHNHEVVHRDIKPENILVSEDGTCKLCDFGLSKVLEKGNKHLSGECGTPFFLAPEILNGASAYDAYAADIWALGVTMFTVVFQCLPFSHPKSACSHDILLPSDAALEQNVPLLYDVLRHMIVRDVHCRVTIGEIAKHPFLCDRVPIYWWVKHWKRDGKKESIKKQPR